ncbi:MAG: RagB/SusD family nutrient uptake outer membrane protein [Carboxylicivirga sp.]|jgi:hypothetical protein|nr:RagB/SusD family nutrient uptake outer membrane protein [Carboxylicivirga sp.]
MKKTIILLLLSAFIISSCEDYLDATDTGANDLMEEDIFSNYNNYRGFVNQIYQGLTDYYYFGYNHFPGCYSDELQWTHGEWFSLAPFAITAGDYWSGDRNNETRWEYKGDGSVNDGYGYSPLESAYPAIRAANLSIENMYQLNDGTKDYKKDELLGQAYFMRAWFHFEIIRRVGGMPYISRVLDTYEDMDFERPSYRACTDSIVADCNRAAALLPEKWGKQDADFGRVTKGAALALKGMALFYDASPTMNYQANKTYTYDNERLSQALEAYNEVIDLAFNKGVYELMDGSTPGAYGEIFYSRNEMFSKEAIFGVTPSNKRKGYSEDIFRSRNMYNSMFSPQPYDKRYKKRNTAPTHNLVSLFETANGLSIADDDTYNEKKPYNNRDPRFYNSILYDGVKFGIKKGKPFTFKTIGNIDGNTNWTGYYIRKLWPETANDLSGTGDYNYQQNWIYIRLTGILLDYAEAANEVYGPDVVPEDMTHSALSVVNMIRERSGHVPVYTRYTTDKETFREKIRNERAVELCFEHVRWFDLRRWHVAHEAKHRKIYRMNKVSGNYVIEERPELERVFEERHYWYPVKRDDVDMLGNLEQNPGW